MRSFFVIATIGLLSMSASTGSCAAIGDNVLVKRSACDNASFIDVVFDVNSDSPRFATCKNVPINSWSQSSTPNDFAYCRKEIQKCSYFDFKHFLGLCIRSANSCQAAEDYCKTLGGVFSCSG